MRGRRLVAVCQRDVATRHAFLRAERPRIARALRVFFEGESSPSFKARELYSPPQGALRFLRPSRFFEPESEYIEGFFKIEADDDEGVPTYVQWRTKCLGIESVGLPAGSLYFNAKIDGEKRGGSDTAGDGGGEKSVRMSSGVATIKRDVKASFLGADYSGIMAEYIVVGTFTGTRRN